MYSGVLSIPIKFRVESIENIFLSWPQSRGEFPSSFILEVDSSVHVLNIHNVQITGRVTRILANIMLNVGEPVQYINF